MVSGIRKRVSKSNPLLSPLAYVPFCPFIFFHFVYKAACPFPILFFLPFLCCSLFNQYDPKKSDCHTAVNKIMCVIIQVSPSFVSSLSGPHVLIYSNRDALHVGWNSGMLKVNMPQHPITRKGGMEASDRLARETTSGWWRHNMYGSAIEPKLREEERPRAGNDRYSMFYAQSTAKGRIMYVCFVLFFTESVLR